MNIFELAVKELKREKKNPQDLKQVINKAVIIRKWIDKHRGVTDKILQGYTIYKYKNTFKYYLPI